MRARIGMCVACAVLSACGDDESNAEAPENANPKAPELTWAPVPASEAYADKTLQEWAVEWRRWSFSATTCDSTVFDSDGSNCELFQDPESPVFFMDYSPTKVTRTRCRVPAGKAIMVPLVAYSNDNIDVDPPQSAEELEEAADVAFDSMRGLRLHADRATVENPDEWAVAPTSFTYYVPPAPNWFSCNMYDGVADTVIEPAYLSGYFAVFPPPEPGEHELRFGGVETVSDDDYSFDITNRFVVEDYE